MAEPSQNLSIYNTLVREKEQFVPIKPGEVGMYTCGPTVYNYQHIGNMRTSFLKTSFAVCSCTMVIKCATS